MGRGCPPITHSCSCQATPLQADEIEVEQLLSQVFGFVNVCDLSLLPWLFRARGTSRVLEQTVYRISSMELQYIYIYYYYYIPLKHLQIIPDISVSDVHSFQEELLAAGFEVALPELIRVQRQARSAKTVICSSWSKHVLSLM